MNKESGQGLAEYTIVLSLVGVATLAGAAFLGSAIRSKITAITGSVAGVESSSIEENEKQALESYRLSQESSRSVSGMRIKTKGHGKETIDEQDLRK